MNTQLNIHSAVDHARDRAELVCNEAYGHSPKVQLIGDFEVEIPYISTHIDYILYELLKNSMR